MSAMLPTRGQSNPEVSPPAAPPISSQPSKPQRVLACVLCQQRKVKCNRKFPCSNCLKARVQCVPALLAPRQRRRRFTERELLDRIRNYEGLLRRNNVKFEPLHKAQDEANASPNADGCYDSDYEPPGPMRVDDAASSPSTNAKAGRVYGAKYALFKKHSQR
jgi:Fungal Zn(2)-Cys(6) binuclear cluster domain